MHVDHVCGMRSPLVNALAHMRGLADFSLAIQGKQKKVMYRSEFNSCGETSNAATTYTGISMRSLSELPRMSYQTKQSILGAASCASVPTKRMQRDIDEKGHPFSFHEVKPISFWQTMMEHLDVTHIVDFTPGSGALAVAASGAMTYEGIAVNDAHRDWLDSIVDKCVMYKAGHNQGYAEKLGGDDGFVAKASMYFSGAMMEARRWLERVPAEDDEVEGGGSDSSSADA